LFKNCEKSCKNSILNLLFQHNNSRLLIPDFLAIAPFIFEVILFLVGLSGENVRKVRWAFLTVRLLRVLRVVRIAKLGRFSPGLANFVLTLRKSKKQLQMVAIVLLTVMIFFSTLVYFLVSTG
jgi:hypothetical protein